MSDPSRPPSEEMSAKQKQRSIAPDAYFKVSDKHIALLEKFKRVPDVQELFAGKRLTPKHAVELVPSLHTEAHVKVSITRKLATTDAGPGTDRKRSGLAKDVANAGYRFLPETHPFASVEAVKNKMEKTVRFENMGTVMCLGRLKKYLPEASIRRKNFDVPGKDEVGRSLERCGLSLKHMDVEELMAVPLLKVVSEGPGTGIKVSKHSYNGLPTEGDSSNHEAMALCQRLAAKIQVKLEQVYYDDGDEGVISWLDVQRRKRPHLVTLMGQAKDDCYDVQKYENFEIRFYTAWPRPINMLIQTVAQTHAKFKRSILDQPTPLRSGAELHGFSGVSLAHGGADKLVEKLDDQLELNAFAHVVMGDDSVVFIKFKFEGRWYIVRLSLDCKSFDLTQVGYVSHPVHDGLAEEYARFNRPRALLWRELMKKRDIVIDKTLNFELEDMGTSGGIGQSDVNSVLMDIAITRFEEEFFEKGEEYVLYKGVDPRAVGDPTEAASPRRDLSPTTEDFEERFGSLFLQVAREMGFSAKVEDAVCIPDVTTVRDMLRVSPMLFVGYHFSIDKKTGKVHPFCDLPRVMAQLVYPKGPKLKKVALFNILESIRLAGVVASMGVPPPELVLSFEAMRMKATSILTTHLEALGTMDEGPEFDASEQYANYLEDLVLGPDLPKTVEGLLRLLLHGTEKVWLEERNQQEMLEEYGPGSVTFMEEVGFATSGPIAEGLLEDTKTREAMEKGNPFAVLEEALKKQASDAREERPASKRTQGRPPPITTEAEIAAKAEAREIRRLHQKEERRAVDPNPFDEFNQEEPTYEPTKEEAIAEEIEEELGRERAQSSTFGSEASDDDDVDAMSSHTISSDEGQGTSYGRSRAPVSSKRR